MALYLALVFSSRTAFQSFEAHLPLFIYIFILVCEIVLQPTFLISSIYSAISSHLQTCGCSVVVGSSAEKVNKVIYCIIQQIT